MLSFDLFKKALILFFLSLSLVFISSCDILFGGNSSQPPAGEKPGEEEQNEPENLIFSKSSNLSVIMGEGCDSDSLDRIVGGVLAVRDLPNIGNTSTGKAEHEIIIGNSDRAVTLEANRLLSRLVEEEEDEESYVIYSDGSSVAIVFSGEAGLCSAIDKFVNDYLIRDTLILPSGNVASDSIKVYEYYYNLDVAQREEQWQILHDYLAAEPNGEDVYLALRGLYLIYDPSMIEWLANLFDTNICVCYGLNKETVCSHTKYCGTAGFYYSNSGRDTYGYLPDVESTNQAGNILSHVGLGGLKDVLDEKTIEKVGKFVLALQEPNGYFYHPQWEKSFIDSSLSRRSRDLTWATSILTSLGIRPIYDTPNGIKGSGATLSSAPLCERLGVSTPLAVSRVVLADSEVANPILQDRESFEEYLSSLDLSKNSYHIGNTVSAMCNEIVARDAELKAEGADYSLGEILIEWLNSGMIEGTGHWNGEIDPESGEVVAINNYYAVNGIMKISGIYNVFKVPYPDADKAALAAVSAITSDEPVGQIVDIYNTWFAIGELRTNIATFAGKSEAEKLNSAIYANAADAITATMEKLTVFLKLDGSFSYNPTRSADTSQGAPVALPGTNEGDMNATNIAVSTKNHLFSVLSLPRVDMFGKAESYTFKSIVESHSKVSKEGVGAAINVGEPYDFDYDNIGDFNSDSYLRIEAKNNGNIEIDYDPREGREGNVLKLTSPAGSGEALKSYLVSTNDGTGNAIVYDTEMCIQSSSYRITAQVSVESIYYFTICCEGGKVKIIDDNRVDTSYDLGAVGNVGEWFRIRLVIHLGEKDSFRVVLYADNDLTDGSEDLVPISVSNNYRIYDSKKPDEVGSKFNYVKFYVMSSENTVIYFDNFHNYKCREDYSPFNTEEDGLYFNIEDVLGSENQADSAE